MEFAFESHQAAIIAGNAFTRKTGRYWTCIPLTLRDGWWMITDRFHPAD